MNAPKKAGGRSDGGRALLKSDIVHWAKGEKRQESG